MRASRLSLAFLLSLSSSCSAPPDPASGDPPPHPHGDPPNTITLRMDPITLQPGEETTRCVTAHLPTTAPIDVVRIETSQTATHHVIFYREEVDLPDNPTRRCAPLNLLEGGRVQRLPLFIGETPEAELRMPPGVAYRLGAGAAYTIEGHYINPSAQPVTTSAAIVLHTAPAGTEVIEADMLFYASVTALNKMYDGRQRGLPPGQIITIQPAGFRAPKPGVKLFGLTSHQHRMGVDFVISKSTGRDDPGQMLYRNQDWEHPPLLRFPDGQLLTFDESKGEGLRWECTYHNRNDFYLTFGQSAVRNEMCILWGYYYPSKGFDIHFE